MIACVEAAAVGIEMTGNAVALHLHGGRGEDRRIDAARAADPERGRRDTQRTGPGDFRKAPGGLGIPALLRVGLKLRACSVMITRLISTGWHLLHHPVAAGIETDQWNDSDVA
jgi:hypothetical protein